MDFENSRGIGDRSSQHLTLLNVILEPIPADGFDGHWGYLPGTQGSLAGVNLSDLQSLRAYRALVLPLVILDYSSDDLNSLKEMPFEVTPQGLVFYHPLNPYFETTTRSDLEWMVQKFETLHFQDWKNCVSQSQLPEGLQNFVLFNLIKRHNRLHSLLMGQPSRWINRVPENYSSRDGWVKNNIVARSTSTGKSDDSNTPFYWSRLNDYLRIRGFNLILKKALEMLNQRLTVLSQEDWYQKHLEKIEKRLDENKKKSTPSYETIHVWGGPIGGFNVNASRGLIQEAFHTPQFSQLFLVDQVSFSTNIGLFLTVSGLETFKPKSISELWFTRQFSYYSPLKNKSDIRKIPWSRVLVPLKMLEMAKLIDSQFNWDQIINEFEKNQVLIISDQVMFRQGFQTSSPLDPLLGFQMFNF